MIRLVVFFSVLLFYSGCSLISSNIDTDSSDIYVSKRVYKDVSKDAILEATKKMFLVANKNIKNNEFLIDSYRDKVEVSRVVIGNMFLGADMYLDKWIVEVYQFEGETRINLSIVRTDAVEQKKSFEVPKQTYDQYWIQLDFLLGLNQKWMDCDTNKYSGEFFDVTLCSEFFYNSKLFTAKPKEEDKIKDIYISQRGKKNYTIDKIKTNIFENPSLNSTQDMDDIYSNSENVEDIKLRRTIMEDQIFDTKEEKVEVANESDTGATDTKDKIDSTKSTGDEKIKEEDINAFTKNINNIVNKKKE